MFVRRDHKYIIIEYIQKPLLSHISEFIVYSSFLVHVYGNRNQNIDISLRYL